MCGILGGNAFVNLEEMEKGLTSMMHRGTDGNTIFHFPENDFYLSHNRLSIQDLSEIANQPMRSDDDRYFLAFNGELWKSTFTRFNKPLRQKYNFKTERSDTELLLYYLIDNKDNLKESMQELEGMFCFAFYDKKKDEVILGRDFIGRLPFYYLLTKEGKLVFSSEIKGIEQSLKTEYYNIDKGSRFKSANYKDKEVIKTVPPGTYIKLEISKHLLDKDGNHSIYTENEVRWFDFKPNPFDNKEKTYYPRTDAEFKIYDEEDKGEEFYTKGFRKRLERAVDEELISDVPICTILSGGIDSTIITYLLSQIYPNVEAFVVNVNQKRQSKLKDDLYFARVAAKEFGIKLHEVNVDQDDIESYLRESIWAAETHKWTQVSPAVAQLFLSWEIRDKGFKVVFGGEGADEIFASYGDVYRFCWRKPIWYHQKRVNLLDKLHKNNLIRTNKVMMYGGKVELRTPFMNKEVIDFGLRIPTRYRDEKDGKGNVMKYILRKAFEGDISDDLLWRPKKTFQIGCHTAYLKNEKEKIEDYFENLFVNHIVPDKFIKRHIGHNRGRIEKIIIEK